MIDMRLGARANPHTAARRVDGVGQPSPPTYAAAAGTVYVELDFEDTASTCVRAVHGYVAWDPQNTNQANHGRTSVYDDTAESVVRVGDMAANNTLLNPKSAPVFPKVAPWTRQLAEPDVALVVAEI